VQEQHPEIVQFMGVECHRELVSSDGNIIKYVGKIFRGEHPWIEIRIHQIDPPDKKRVHMVNIHGQASHFECQTTEGLEAAEKLIRLEIQVARRDLDVLAHVEPSANESIRSSLHAFGLAWSELPALVRAGHAHAASIYFRSRMSEDRSMSKDAADQGLMRRSRVRGHFADASHAMADLMAHLVREADADAERSGYGRHDGGDSYQVSMKFNGNGTWSESHEEIG
jgi:hypothetical protein